MPYCRDCGALLVQRHIEDRLRHVCPACGRVDYRQPTVGAGVLIEVDGRILLVRRNHEPFFGAWNLPAGHCEVDEAPAQTAVREAAEETGLRVRVTGLEDVYFFDDSPAGNGLMILYRAEIVGGELTDTAEAKDGAFFGPDDLPRPLALAGHDRAVAAWRRRLRSP